MEYIHHLHTWEHLLKPWVLSPLRRNGVELVPLACEDDTGIECLLKLNISGHTTHSLKTALMHKYCGRLYSYVGNGKHVQ